MLLASSRSLALLPLLPLLLLSACTETSGPGGGGIFGGITLGNAGLGGPGFVGFADTDLPRSFSYLFDSSISGGAEQCARSGVCGHGGGNTRYGAMLGSDSLLFVTTSDFPTGFGDDTAFVFVSGVEHDSISLPASTLGKRLRLTFEFAFLQSSVAAQDSAVMQLLVNGQPVRVFRVTGADIGRTLLSRLGGCGTADIPFPTAFPICSDWTASQIDLTPYRGVRTPIRIIVGESGRTKRRAATLLIRAIRFEEEQ